MMTSNPEGKEGRSERARRIRQASIALSIPSVMIGAPLGFGALAWLIHCYLSVSAWVVPVGAGIGLLVAIHQTIQLLRMLDRMK
jgi:uncharacterized membrane protein